MEHSFRPHRVQNVLKLVPYLQYLSSTTLDYCINKDQRHEAAETTNALIEAMPY